MTICTDAGKIGLVLADAADSAAGSAGWMDKLGQYGLATLILGFIAAFVWRHGATIVTAFVGLSKSVTEMAEHMKAFVETAQGDRKDAQDERVLFHTRIDGIERDAKDILERVKQIQNRSDT